MKKSISEKKITTYRSNAPWEERPQGEGTADGKQQLRRRGSGTRRRVRMSLVEESHTNPVNNLDNNKAKKTEQSVESRCLERIFDTKRRRCLFYDGPRSRRPWLLIGWRGPTALTGEIWRNAYSMAVCMQCIFRGQRQWLLWTGINDWNSNRDCSFPWLPVVLAPWQAQERADQERERVGNGGFKPACTVAALCTVYAE